MPITDALALDLDLGAEAGSLRRREQGGVLGSEQNMFQIDTTPGKGGPFSPPETFSGDGYGTWLKMRYDQDPGFRQEMVIVARHVCGRAFVSARVLVTGPFADELRVTLRKLDSFLHAPPRK